MDTIFLYQGIVLGLVSIIGLLVASWVIISAPRSLLNQLLFMVIVATLLYSSTDYLSGVVEPTLSMFLLRLTYAIAPITALIFFLFTNCFPDNKFKIKFLDLIFIAATLSISVATVASGLVVKSLIKQYWGYGVVVGEQIYLYYGILVILLVSSAYNLILKYTQSTKRDRQKIKFILFGAVISLAVEIIFNILMPIFGLDKLYFIGDYSIIIFFIFTAYAIVRHGLFDVRLAIVRSVSYSLVLVTLTGIYAAIAFIFSFIFNRGPVSFEQTAIGVISSILMALMVQPLKRFFDKITNRIFYKDIYEIGDFVSELNRTLTSTTELRGLLERTAYEIAQTLKSEQAFFFINTKGGHYVCAGTHHHKQMPKADAEELSRVCGNGEIILASYLKSDSPTKRLLLSHRVEMLLPLMRSDKILGYLCLGDNLSSGYTRRDIRALKTVSDELVIAIQNALAVEEIRDLNTGLQQRINNATKELRASNAVLRQLDKIKDEFVGMASHQLRTPLTSVKGYISMVLEGDAGKITDTQRNFLNEAYESSERMVGLINDFLNVSRLQTGKFVIEKTQFDLSEVVEQEINILRPNAVAHKLKYNYMKPKDFPIIEADEAKIRQVVMNFADNALYYSREDSTIEIGLMVEGGDIVYTVKDTGIGVPINEQAHLFTKFFRATNARKRRPDGTGVGLYLAKKIIEAHNGKIVFESVEGQGSTFGFRLPLSKSSPVNVD